MSVAWGPRLTAGSLSWASRTASATEGVINGVAEVSASVERDLALLWQVNGGVTADLSLLWQLDASLITAVESDLSLTWQVIYEAGSTVERDLDLLWQRGGSAMTSLSLVWQVSETRDVAGAVAARRPVRHPGWSRRQARDALARERAMERTITRALRGESDELPPALAVAKPPQRSPAQIAAEMANAQRVQATRQRATEAAIEAQRARIEIQRLQPELAARRRVASFRAVEQLLRQV